MAGSHPAEQHPASICEHDGAPGLEGLGDVLDWLDVQPPPNPPDATGRRIAPREVESGPYPPSGVASFLGACPGSASPQGIRGVSGLMKETSRRGVTPDSGEDRVRDDAAALHGNAGPLPRHADVTDWLAEMLSEPHADVECRRAAATLRPQDGAGVECMHATSSDASASAQGGVATLGTASQAHCPSKRDGNEALDREMERLASSYVEGIAPRDLLGEHPRTVPSDHVPCALGISASAKHEDCAALPSLPAQGAAPVSASIDPLCGGLGHCACDDAQAGPTCGSLCSPFHQAIGAQRKSSSPRDSVELVRAQPSEQQEPEEVLLPRDVMGYVPQAHYINLLDDLFSRGVTLGLDKLVGAPAADRQQNSSGSGSSSSAISAELDSPEASQARPRGGEKAMLAPTSSPPPQDPCQLSPDLVAGLPPAVRMKVFGSLTPEPIGEGEPRSSTDCCLAFESQALRPRALLNDRLAAALSAIQETGSARKPKPHAVSVEPMAEMGPLGSGRKRTQAVSVVRSFNTSNDHQALADLLQGHQPQKRMHVEMRNGPLKEGILRGPLASRGMDPALSGASCSGLRGPAQRQAGTAITALVLPRRVAPPSSKAVERETLLMQLTDLALCLERNDLDRFGALYARLRSKGRRHGSASERSVYNTLQSLIFLRDGTGFDFVSKPSRQSIQEMDDSRKWYFTVHPGLLFSHILCSGLALPKLKGHRSIHIVSIGSVMQWPMFFKLLAQDPAYGAKLKRVRLTCVDIWPISCPKRTDVQSMRALGLLSITIGAAAAQMGVECITRIVTVEDESLDWLDAINRRPDEALAVCSGYDVSYIRDEPKHSGGFRQRLFQAMIDLRADVFTMAELDVHDGSCPSLALRLQGCFRFLWALLHSHDSLGIQLHKNLGFMEHIAGVHNVVGAISFPRTQRRWHPQSASQWHQSLLSWGFTPLNVDASAVAMMKGIMKAYPDSFQVECAGPWLQLVTEGMPLVSASAWTA